MNKTDIARIAHEINRAYCAAIGDHSQVAWEDAPDWQKESAIKGVQFHLDNPDATPEDSHKSWLKQKADEGWGHGPVKDVERKQHPCFTEYENLPEFQRAKDYLFRALVHLLSPSMADVTLGIPVNENSWNGDGINRWANDHKPPGVIGVGKPKSSWLHRLLHR